MQWLVNRRPAPRLLLVACLAAAAASQSLAVQSQASIGIQFVSAKGNDANDGSSYGAAKRTIGAAYRALPPTGGTIRVSGGAVAWPALTASLNHLRIECDPGATIAVAPRSSVTLTGSDQAVDDCHFTGPGTATATSSPLVLEGSRQAVTRNTFAGFAASLGEVYLRGATHATIAHNRFFDNATDEVFGEMNTTDVVVRDNVIEGSRHGSASHDIAFHSTKAGEVVRNISIIGNDIVGAGNFCVEVGSFGGDVATNITVAGNTCQLGAAGAGGYSVGGGTRNFSIAGNTYDANGFTTGIGGIEVASGAGHGFVSGNSIYFGKASSGSPVSISTTYGSVTDIEVAGNAATFSWTGNLPRRGGCLVASDSAAYVLERISFTGNTCDMSGSTGRGSQATQGVWLQCNSPSATCIDLRISGNALLGADLGGDVPIDVERDSGTMHGVQIDGNSLQNWAGGIIASENTISPPHSARMGPPGARSRRTEMRAAGARKRAEQ